MASIQKYGKGFRAFVALEGQRTSKTFLTRREAVAWAAACETEIRANKRLTPGERHSFADALLRYSEEVSVSKRGGRWERIRIEAFMNESSLDASTLIGEVTPEMLGVWRDARLKEVKPGTVLRDISLLSAIFETARREWRWITTNPVGDMRKPKSPDHRERVITPAEVKAMLKVMGYAPSVQPCSITQAVAVCFLVALRTGMRAGELCGLTWDRVYMDYVVLPVTKTVPRNVPLSKVASRLIERMRGFDPVLVFGVSAPSLDALFRKYRARAGLSGFTFHDARHTAATMLARKLDVLDLCKMFGWANPKQAMVYYNPSASEIAARLGRK